MFTDDDLMILKANRAYWAASTQSQPNHLDGLIARLEAAERVCAQVKMGEPIDWDPFNQAYASWCQVAGKDWHQI